MSEALSCGMLGWADIEGQRVELLPARTVLTTGCYNYNGHWNYDDWTFGGDAGDGGDGNEGGDGVGGDGGDAHAIVANNENHGGIQVNMAFAFGGVGGYGFGGGVDADGGDGGYGGDAKE
jgi:hypothetical protein